MIYGYCRVSTETQAAHGFGLETQRERLTAYGVDAGNIYQDAGVSGTVADREGLNALLAALEKGDKIVVLNTSRLWRSDTVKVLIHHELRKIGADIVSLEQPSYTVYSIDPNDFLINGILEILDQYDRMLISRKLAAGRRTKAKSGQKACGRAPDGYKWQGKSIVPDETRADIITQVFTLQGKLRSYQKTADKLNAARITSATGGTWSKQQVGNIVNNDFYIGIVTHAGTKYQGTHEPIVSKDLWQAVH